MLLRRLVRLARVDPQLHLLHRRFSLQTNPLIRGYAYIIRILRLPLHLLSEALPKFMISAISHSLHKIQFPPGRKVWVMQYPTSGLHQPPSASQNISSFSCELEGTAKLLIVYPLFPTLLHFCKHFPPRLHYHISQSLPTMTHKAYARRLIYLAQALRTHPCTYTLPPQTYITTTPKPQDLHYL